MLIFCNVKNEKNHADVHLLSFEKKKFMSRFILIHDMNLGGGHNHSHKQSNKRSRHNHILTVFSWKLRDIILILFILIIDDLLWFFLNFLSWIEIIIIIRTGGDSSFHHFIYSFCCLFVFKILFSLVSFDFIKVNHAAKERQRERERIKEEKNKLILLNDDSIRSDDHHHSPSGDLLFLF